MKVDFGLELAPICRRDLEMMRGWRNDHKIWKWARQNDLISDVDQEAWFNRQAADPRIKMYLIVRRVDGDKKPIGVCGLTDIDMLNRRAEFSLYVAVPFQRRGYGREALKILLAHGFMNLGLENIWGESFDGNPAMKIFDGLGFQREGVRRGFYLKDGVFVDAHLFAMRRQEWIQSLSASAPSSSSRSLPMPTASEHGPKKSGIIEATIPRTKTHRRRGPGLAKEISENQSLSLMKEPGSLNKRNDEAALDHLDAEPRLRGGA